MFCADIKSLGRPVLYAQQWERTVTDNDALSLFAAKYCQRLPLAGAVRPVRGVSLERGRSRPVGRFSLKSSVGVKCCWSIATLSIVRSALFVDALALIPLLTCNLV